MHQFGVISPILLLSRNLPLAMLQPPLFAASSPVSSPIWVFFHASSFSPFPIQGCDLIFLSHRNFVNGSLDREFVASVRRSISKSNFAARQLQRSLLSKPNQRCNSFSDAVLKTKVRCEKQSNKNTELDLIAIQGKWEELPDSYFEEGSGLVSTVVCGGGNTHCASYGWNQNPPWNQLVEDGVSQNKKCCTYNSGHCHHEQVRIFSKTSFGVEDLEQSLSSSEIYSQTVEDTTTGSYSDLNKHLEHKHSFAKVHKLAKAPVCLPLGVPRNSLIKNIGCHGTYFFQPSEVELMPWENVWQKSARFWNGSHVRMVTAAVKALPDVIDVGNDVEASVPAEVSCTVKSSTTKRHNSQLRKRNTATLRKRGKFAPQRDLFRRSPFQLYEVLLCYPYMNSKSAALSFQSMSRESFEELLAIFSHVAAGLAGSGLALILFVSSRMLLRNAAFDSSKVTGLVRGIGLIWLSSAVQRFRDLVRHLSNDAYTKFQRKELQAKLRTELQTLTFKAFTLIALSMIRLV
eukprot:c25880_g1_i1 orf=576-2123(-)